jgi:hypothetical protein
VFIVDPAQRSLFFFFLRTQRNASEGGKSELLHGREGTLKGRSVGRGGIAGRCSDLVVVVVVVAVVVAAASRAPVKK